MAFTIVFLLLSAFFSASETALFSIPREKVTFYRKSSKRGKLCVYSLLNDANGTLVTILVGNLFVNVSAVGFINRLVSSYIMDNVFVTLVIATLTILIFGEIIPKNIALGNNEKIAVFSAPFILMLKRILSPIARTLTGFNVKLIKFFTLHLWKPVSGITKDEFISSFTEIMEESGIDNSVNFPLVNFLSVSNKSVSTVMIHKSRLHFFDYTLPLKFVKKDMYEKKLKFAILFSSSKENPDGVVFYSDIVNAENGDLKTFSHSLSGVMGTHKIAEVFSLMLKEHKDVVSVKNEYGEFFGVLYIWDVSTKIFPKKTGNDSDGESERVVSRAVFSGSEELIDIEEWLPLQFRNRTGSIKTLNGILIDYFGKIPSAGDSVAIDGYKFYIRNAKPNFIEKVIIEK